MQSTKIDNRQEDILFGGLKGLLAIRSIQY
jgi:hypothetical protein